MSEQIMRKWTEAFKNADWETVASLYADDAVGSDPTGAIYSGREANLANDKTWRKTFSDFKLDLQNSFNQEIKAQLKCKLLEQ